MPVITKNKCMCARAHRGENERIGNNLYKGLGHNIQGQASEFKKAVYHRHLCSPTSKTEREGWVTKTKTKKNCPIFMAYFLLYFCRLIHLSC